MKDVIVVIGPGQIGQAIARRVAIGKHVLLADLRRESANVAAEILGNAGYDVSIATVDARRSRTSLGARSNLVAPSTGSSASTRSPTATEL
jgi:saccharopine dehydrogenase-like NADP-dependent oxidoreductase